MADKLLFKDIIGSAQCYHVARTVYGVGSSHRAHRHDFAEVFWIEAGEGVHHINGHRQKLGCGDLLLIRPEDCHALAAPSSAMTLVNIAFPRQVLRDLKKRYAGGVEVWPWDKAKMPPRFSVSAHIDQLTQWVGALGTCPNRVLELDWFLINLLHLLLPTAPAATPPGQPEWLHRTLTEFRNPAHLPGGVATFIDMTGLSPEHVNRTIRRCLGLTTTDLVNRLRMEYAAAQLRMTNLPIARIALDCGLENLGYFYRLFQTHFQTTPRQFRIRELRTIR